jgi:hypothetical protein
MAADIAAPPPVLATAPRFSIGRTLSLGFVVLWRNLWRLSAVALTVSAMQAAIEFYAPIANTGLLSLGVALLMFALVTSPVTAAAVQYVRGDRPTLAGMLRGGLRRLVRVAIGAVMLFFGLLVPPGLFLVLGTALQLPTFLLLLLNAIAAIYALAVLAMWFVTMPVLVAEDVGVFSSFRRSRYLTRDHRWGTLALALILAVMVFVMMTIALTVRLSFVVSAPMQMMLHPWLSLTMIPLNAFSSLVIAIIPAVAYHLLQTEREGAGADALARVFE